MHTLVGILEDDQNLRNLLNDYIQLKNCALAFSFGSIRETLNNVEVIESPDIIFLDEHLGDESGVNSLNDFKKHFPGAKIIVMTGDTSQELIRYGIENGASGFIYKPFSFKEIGQAIKSLNETGFYLQNLCAPNLILSLQSERAKEKVVIKKLSSKEWDVAKLLIVGRSYKEIASLLNKSFYSVNYHIKNMYAKFGVNSKTELIFHLNKNIKLYDKRDFLSGYK